MRQGGGLSSFQIKGQAADAQAGGHLGAGPGGFDWTDTVLLWHHRAVHHRSSGHRQIPALLHTQHANADTIRGPAYNQTPSHNVPGGLKSIPDFNQVTLMCMGCFYAPAVNPEKCILLEACSAATLYTEEVIGSPWLDLSNM